MKTFGLMSAFLGLCGKGSEGWGQPHGRVTEACRPPSSLQLEQVGFTASVILVHGEERVLLGVVCVCM